MIRTAPSKALLLLLGLLVALATGNAALAESKQRIDKEADLPRFTYPINGKLEDLLRDDAKFRSFASAVRRDTESTLAKYEITDKASEQK